MDILNFISWIKGSRLVTSVDASKTLLPVGLKDPKRDDGYLAGTITVEDFASALAPSIFDDEGNVFIGKNAFNSIVFPSKENNIAIGENTLNNVIQNNNIGIGYAALRYTTTGGYNIAIGDSTLLFNTIGDANIGMGSATLFFNTTGDYNVAIGVSALFSNTTGNDNIGIGNSAITGNTTGQSVVAIGRETDNQNYSYCVLLGRQAQATANNQFVVGSPGYNVGTVSVESNTSSQVWNVRINGVDRKILLA